MSKFKPLLNQYRDYEKIKLLLREKIFGLEFITTLKNVKTSFFNKTRWIDSQEKILK